MAASRARQKASRGQPFGARITAAAVLAISALVMTASLAEIPAHAQDATQYLDLKSDEFTKADMSRADIEAGIAALKDGETLDLSAKRLNGLDLSGMDLTRVRLQSARINAVNFRGAKFDAVILDQAWALK
ncbi:MAG: pentapeptide repeat-containing protein, partial [Hyphomicrobium sp.]